MHRSTFELSGISAIVVVVAFVSVAMAQSGILESVHVSRADGTAIVSIDLSEPVRYLSQALSPSGTVLQIRLTRLGTTSGEDLPGRDRIVPPGLGGRLITEIAYERGSGDDGTLFVRFKQAARPTMYPQGDAKSLSISVPLPSDMLHGKSDNASSPPAAGGVAAAPVAPGRGPARARRSPNGATEGSLAASSSSQAVVPATIAGVMEAARRAMITKDYPKAVRYFTKVLLSNDAGFKQEAQELLGVAQERCNHRAVAKAEYEKYLRLYPSGEGADRVRQRLAAMLEPTREPTGPNDAPRSWRSPMVKYLAGSLSQFFRRDSSISDAQGDLLDQSYLASYLDLTGRVRTEGYDVRAQASGGYRLDIEGASRSSNDLRLRYLYLDATDRKRGINARVGRQSRSTGGVLGRFDGVLLDYRLTERTRLNAVAGFPVDLTTANTLDTNRYFYGLSVDYGTFAKYWDASLFAIQQQADGLLDRRAVGGEIRYFRPEASLFTLVDYDISYMALNILLMQGTYTFENSATLGIVVDYRDTPALTTSNALIGQPVNMLSDLRGLYGEDQIRNLAADRTQRSMAVTLSGSHPLSDKLQIAADFTVDSLASTPASGGVEATPPTGEEYTFSSQLIGSGVVWPGDIEIFGVRYANTDVANTGSLMVNSRIPIGDAWRLNPRFQADLQSRTGGSKVVILKPALLVDYRWGRALMFEMEVGYERVQEVAGSTDSSRHGYYVNVGYRWDF